MGLVPVSQLALEGRRIWVINIEINESDCACIFCLKPVHDGCDCSAGRSPEGEKLHQNGTSRGQRDRTGIGSLEG